MKVVDDNFYFYLSLFGISWFSEILVIIFSFFVGVGGAFLELNGEHLVLFIELGTCIKLELQLITDLKV